MATIRDILSHKGTSVQTIRPEATVLEAAQVMNRHKIGALVVVADNELQGIFTERDVLRRIVAEQRDSASVRVADVMTTEVACCRTTTSIDEARAVMKNRRIRHMPVIDEGRTLLGLISIGDLNAHEANAQEQTIYFLHEYIYGRT
ncbi:MAG: CBS domain-containing protein [Phycisphaera sp.]|nr:CBS domain-containing protein [Phycisphaera sp.]